MGKVNSKCFGPNVLNVNSEVDRSFFHKFGESSDQPRDMTPRVCFLSLFDLYNKWRIIPMDILYHSLIILNCKRRLIFDDTESDDNSQLQLTKKMEHISQHIDMHSIADNSDFKAFLNAKELQNRLYWIDNDNDWLSISEWLFQHDDPATQVPYNPLILNQNWWQQRYEQEILSIAKHANNGLKTKYTNWEQLTCIQHCDSVNKVARDLTKPKWQYTIMSEIIHQSNPTLLPMAHWNATEYETKAALINRVISAAQSSLELELSLQSISALPSPISNESDNDDIDDDVWDNIDDCDTDDVSAYSNELRVSFGIEGDDGMVYLYD